MDPAPLHLADPDGEIAFQFPYNEASDMGLHSDDEWELDNEIPAIAIDNQGFWNGPGQIAVPTPYPWTSPDGNHIMQTQNNIQVIRGELICTLCHATRIVGVLVRPCIRRAYRLVTYFRDDLHGEASPLWMNPPTFGHCHRENCNGIIRAAVNGNFNCVNWLFFILNEFFTVSLCSIS